MPPEPQVIVTRDEDWTNWHSSVEGRVVRQIDVWNAEPSTGSVTNYNKTTAALQNILQDALNDGLVVRGLGGGWSFSSVAFTNGVLINTRPLNYQFSIPPHFVHPAHPGTADNLWFAQCGTAIAELNLSLRNRKKSLKTSGASNGQTIAGALSTGTHGSAIDVGAVQDTVRALHIITAPDKHVWIERASEPVTTDAVANLFGADLIRDDSLFDAALVNLGAFGLIHGVLLEVEDEFNLQVFRDEWTVTDGLWDALDQLDFSDAELPRSRRPYHFEALINPHGEDPEVFLRIMYKDKRRPSGCRAPDPGQKLGPGDDAATVVGRLADLAPGLTKVIANGLIGGLVREVDGECGTLGQIFNNTTTRGKLASASVGIPLGRVKEAVDGLMEIYSQDFFPGLFALRYVKASRATLAFTRHEPQTCVLELDGVASSKTQKFYDLAWDMLLERDIPFAFHWGKMQRVNAGLTQTMYGSAAIQAWKAARATLLPTQALRDVFATQMIVDLGLAG